jgi:hypothetical protein
VKKRRAANDAGKENRGPRADASALRPKEAAGDEQEEGVLVAGGRVGVLSRPARAGLHRWLVRFEDAAGNLGEEQGPFECSPPACAMLRYAPRPRQRGADLPVPPGDSELGQTEQVPSTPVPARAAQKRVRPAPVEESPAGAGASSGSGLLQLAISRAALKAGVDATALREWVAGLQLVGNAVAEEYAEGLAEAAIDGWGLVSLQDALLASAVRTSLERRYAPTRARPGAPVIGVGRLRLARGGGRRAEVLCEVYARSEGAGGEGGAGGAGGTVETDHGEFPEAEVELLDAAAAQTARRRAREEVAANVDLILLAAHPLADPAPGLAARSLLSLWLRRLSPDAAGDFAASDARAALEAAGFSGAEVLALATGAGERLTPAQLAAGVEALAEAAAEPARAGAEERRQAVRDRCAARLAASLGGRAGPNASDVPARLRRLACLRAKMTAAAAAAARAAGHTRADDAAETGSLAAALAAGSLEVDAKGETYAHRLAKAHAEARVSAPRRPPACAPMDPHLPRCRRA